MCGLGKRQLAVLAWTNKKLFEEVVAAISCPCVRKITFLGPAEEAFGGLERILDLQSLWSGSGAKVKSPSGNGGKKAPIRDKFVKAFVGR